MCDSDKETVSWKAVGRHPLFSDPAVVGTPSTTDKMASILASAASSRSRGDCVSVSVALCDGEARRRALDAP